MSTKVTTYLLLLFAVTSGAAATGYRAPAHQQLTYSFTCPSGASGHITYSSDFKQDKSNELRMWVNGAYLQQDPQITPLLSDMNIESVSALCEGGTTLVILNAYNVEQRKEVTISIHVDDAGKVVSAGV